MTSKMARPNHPAFKGAVPYLIEQFVVNRESGLRGQVDEAWLRPDGQVVLVDTKYGRPTNDRRKLIRYGYQLNLYSFALSAQLRKSGYKIYPIGFLRWTGRGGYAVLQKVEIKKGQQQLRAMRTAVAWARAWKGLLQSGKAAIQDRNRLIYTLNPLGDGLHVVQERVPGLPPIKKPSLSWLSSSMADHLYRACIRGGVVVTNSEGEHFHYRVAKVAPPSGFKERVVRFLSCIPKGWVGLGWHRLDEQGFHAWKTVGSRRYEYTKPCQGMEKIPLGLVFRLGE